MSSTPVLLITGASRGIGAATAKLAAANGFDVAVNYVSDRAAADDVVDAIKAAGRRAVAIKADMGREDDIVRMFEETDATLGRLTHLVYNTGIMGASCRLDAVDPAVLRRVLDVNLLGAFLCARAAIPRISTRHGGRGGAMVFISSAMATLGAAGDCVWYAASKAAIDGMTLGLARELAADGIRVNAVAPGPIATDIHPAGRLEKIIPNVPIGRAGTVDEVARAVIFLLSEQSSFTDGIVLRVAGGR